MNLRTDPIEPKKNKKTHTTDCSLKILKNCSKIHATIHMPGPNGERKYTQMNIEGFISNIHINEHGEAFLDIEANSISNIYNIDIPTLWE